MERCVKKNKEKETYKDFFEKKPQKVIVRFVESSRSELFKETVNADHTLMAKTFIYDGYFPDIIEIYVDNIANYVFKDYRFLGNDYKRSAHLVTLMYGVIHEIFHEFERNTRSLELMFEGEVLV